MAIQLIYLSYLVLDEMNHPLDILISLSLNYKRSLR